VGGSGVFAAKSRAQAKRQAKGGIAVFSGIGGLEQKMMAALHKYA